MPPLRPLTRPAARPINRMSMIQSSRLRPLMRPGAPRLRLLVRPAAPLIPRLTRPFPLRRRLPPQRLRFLGKPRPLL